MQRTAQSSDLADESLTHLLAVSTGQLDRASRVMRLVNEMAPVCGEERDTTALVSVSLDHTAHRMLESRGHRLGGQDLLADLRHSLDLHTGPADLIVEPDPVKKISEMLPQDLEQRDIRR